MDFTRFYAGPDDDGRRLDRVLHVLFTDVQGRNYFSAIRKKLITVNGQRTSPGFRLRKGDEIAIASFLLAGRHEAPRAVPAPAVAFETVFQNDDLTIINKPAGIPVQGGIGSTLNIADVIRNEYRKTAEHGSLAFVPAPLHRLDKHTSGLLAISRTGTGAVAFSQAMREHRVAKEYLGIVQGHPSGEALWQDALQGEDGRTREARTYIRPVAFGNYASQQLCLALFRIETGRKHQIRIHAAAHGFPLFGDERYGGQPIPQNDGGTARAYFLHAYRMCFPADNPLGLPEQIVAPLPEDFIDFLAAALIKWPLEPII